MYLHCRPLQAPESVTRTWSYHAVIWLVVVRRVDESLTATSGRVLMDQFVAGLFDRDDNRLLFLNMKVFWFFEQVEELGGQTAQRRDTCVPPHPFTRILALCLHSFFASPYTSYEVGETFWDNGEAVSDYNNRPKFNTASGSEQLEAWGVTFSGPTPAPDRKRAAHPA